MEKILRFLSRIWIRLLAFNVLLIFLPATAVLTLRTYEQTLLKQQEDSMVQQARILAAALGGRGTLDSDEAEARAKQVLVNMRRGFDARLRVIDPNLQVLADSSVLGAPDDVAAARDDADSAAGQTAAERRARESWVYRLGLLLYRPYARVFLPPEPPILSELDVAAEKVRTRVVRDGLAGRYRAGSVVSPETRSLILYSALPITSGERVVGVALASKSTYQILQDLYDLRLSTFKVILASVGLAIVLSLLVATTIVEPIHRLRRQARAILDRRGRLKGEFKGSRWRDEIGDLTRALAELTRRLRGHIRFIESFASDVSHEFKNPLAAIRNATEILADADDPADRRRFTRMILKDVARLEHLLSGVREITHIDANLEEQPVEEVELAAILRGFVERSELQPRGAARYRLEAAGEGVAVKANPERLAQVFENLLDNAASFSPPGGEVAIAVETRGRDAVVTVRDRGPGIPAEHLERIFDRFFSYRDNGAGAEGPAVEESAGGHAGLGLAIVKTIIEGYGGTVAARNGAGGGAVFEVRLPRAG